MRKVYENVITVEKEHLDIKKGVKSLQEIVCSIFSKQRLKKGFSNWINSLYLISTLYEKKSR